LIRIKVTDKINHQFNANNVKLSILKTAKNLLRPAVFGV